MLRGDTVYYNGPARIPARYNPATYADFDTWVEARVRARTAAMTSAMQAAGLSAPIAGLTDLAAAGDFFPCDPYGKCWAPKDGWDGSGPTPDPTPTTQQTPAESRIRPARPLYTLASYIPQAAQQPKPRPQNTYTEVDDQIFPCMPEAYRRTYMHDPTTGITTLVNATPLFDPYSYRWAVCHAGSWIHQRRRYVWVAGTRRHHHHPIRWVKAGGKTGFVPLHPRDVPGRTPVNLKHGLFSPTEPKPGTPGKPTLEHIAYTPGEPLKVLDEAPKEFRKDAFEPLPRAEEPHIEAHEMREALRGNYRSPLEHASPVHLTFDHKTHGFQLAREEFHAGKSVTVTEKFSSHSGGYATPHEGGIQSTVARAGPAGG
jgi:hypothetical protein